MAKIDEVRQCAVETLNRVVSSEKEFRQFLERGSNLFSYSLTDRLLIYGQKPETTMAASFEDWRDKAGCHVRQGEKGIALFSDRGNSVRYVFSDQSVEPDEGRSMPGRWSFREECGPYVVKSLRDTIKAREFDGELYDQILILVDAACDAWLNENIREEQRREFGDFFKIKYSVAHSTSGEYTDYADLANAEEKAGISIKARESFTNGYSFKEAGVVESEDRGENDEVVNAFKEIMVAYEKKGEDDIAVYTTPERFFTIKNPEMADATATISGIDVYYFTTSYKWVRPDYELTDEDIRRQQEEGLEISVGASENYETQVCNCMWIQDGIGYDMLCTSSAIPAETMFEMAEEMIRK